MPGLVLLEFVLEGARYALPLDQVMEVALRPSWRPLPGSPRGVLGVVNYRGKALPVVDPQRCWTGTESRFSRDAHLLIVRTARRELALLVDRAEGLREVPAEKIQPPNVAARHVAGLCVVDGELRVIQDLDLLLSLDEERQLDGALEQRDVAVE